MLGCLEGPIVVQDGGRWARSDESPGRVFKRGPCTIDCLAFTTLCTLHQISRKLRVVHWRAGSVREVKVVPGDVEWGGGKATDWILF